MSEAARVGRPRSEAARQAILDAALALLNEGGIAGTTIKAVAARAGASRQTIYRWWPGLAELILDALLELGRSEVAVRHSGDAENDLRDFLRRTVRTAARNREALAALMVEAQTDPAFAELFRARFVAERRAALSTLLAACDASLDSRSEGVLADLLFGALWYRLLNRHADLDAAFARALGDAACALLAEP